MGESGVEAGAVSGPGVRALVRWDHAPSFVSPRHHGGVLPRRVLDGTEPSTFLSVAISVYPPGAGAQAVPQETDVVYVIAEGSLRVTVDGEAHDLARYDTIHIARGAVRSISNLSQGDAHLLVLRPPR